MTKRAKKTYLYSARINLGSQVFRGDVRLTPGEESTSTMVCTSDPSVASQVFTFTNVECIGGSTRPFQAEVCTTIGQMKYGRNLFRADGCRNLVSDGTQTNVDHPAPILGRMEVTLRPNYALERNRACCATTRDFLP